MAERISVVEYDTLNIIKNPSELSLLNLQELISSLQLFLIKTKPNGWRKF
jgi:hypothetical protein